MKRDVPQTLSARDAQQDFSANLNVDFGPRKRDRSFSIFSVPCHLSSCDLKRIFCSRNQQGSALVLALLVMLVMSIVIMGMATDSDLDLKISRNLELKNQAFDNAETGIVLAAEVVRESGMLNWPDSNGDDSTSSVDLSDNYRLEINSDLENIYNDGGEIEVYFEGEDNNEVLIAAVSVTLLDGGGFSLNSDGYDFEKNNSESNIAALFLPYKPFSAGMKGCDEVSFDGNAEAESDVVSGGPVYNDDNVIGEVYENQNVICDPLGVEEMVTKSDPDPEFEGDNYTIKDETNLTELDFTYEFEDTYKFNDLKVKDTFVIDEDMEELAFFVDGDLTIDGEMIIEEGTQLVIYVEGVVDVTGNGIVKSDGGSNDLIVYSNNSSDDVGVKIGGTPEFNGAVYAPFANVELHGTPEFSGAVRGKTVKNEGTSNFYYDNVFDDWIESYPGGYFLTNWHSIR